MHTGVHLLRRLLSSAARVHPHTANVISKSRLEMRPYRFVQRLSRKAKRLMHACRHFTGSPLCSRRFHHLQRLVTESSGTQLCGCKAASWSAANPSEPGADVRAGLRQPAAPSWSARPDHRHDPLPVARGRPARQCARHSGPATPNAKAAKRFFRQLLKGLRYVPWLIVTDKLARCGPPTA